MAPRRGIGCLLWLVCATASCKDDKAAGAAGQCQRLAKACTDQDKRIEKLAAECTEATAKLEEAKCTPAALFGCYEKQLCGAGEQAWTLDDLKVLSERHDKCVAEREALASCVSR